MANEYQTPDEAGSDKLAEAAAAFAPQPTPSAMIRAIKAGLPFFSFDQLQERLGVTAAELADCLRIPGRTLARRKTDGKLSTDESERVMRFTRLLRRATEVLGTEERATQWMRSPKRAFNGDTPLRYADTEIGAREVEDLLIRLEHGVFS